jgi:hypothetical protein
MKDEEKIRIELIDTALEMNNIFEITVRERLKKAADKAPEEVLPLIPMSAYCMSVRKLLTEYKELLVAVQNVSV